MPISSKLIPSVFFFKSGLKLSSHQSGCDFSNAIYSLLIDLDNVHRHLGKKILIMLLHLRQASEIGKIVDGIDE